MKDYDQSLILPTHREGRKEQRFVTSASVIVQMAPVCHPYLARACSRRLPDLTVDNLAGRVGVGICFLTLLGVREFLRGVLGVWEHKVNNICSTKKFGRIRLKILDNKFQLVIKAYLKSN